MNEKTEKKGILISIGIVFLLELTVLAGGVFNLSSGILDASYALFMIIVSVFSIASVAGLTVLYVRDDIVIQIHFSKLTELAEQQKLNESMKYEFGVLNA